MVTAPTWRLASTAAILARLEEEPDMDPDRFDSLARTLSTTRSRRSLGRLLGGLGLGGVIRVLSVREVAAAPLNGGNSCTKGSDCKTGKCLINGKCSCSSAFPTCKKPANPCKQASCDFGTKRCVTANAPVGTACLDEGNECTRNICDRSGLCTHPNKKNGASCTSGSCQGGVCESTSGCSPACTGGRECQANGTCQCPANKPHTAPDQNCDFTCRECCIDSHCGGIRHCDNGLGGICVCSSPLHDCEGNGVCWSCCTDQHCAAFGQAPGDGFICTVQHACR